MSWQHLLQMKTTTNKDDIPENIKNIIYLHHLISQFSDAIEEYRKEHDDTGGGLSGQY